MCVWSDNSGDGTRCISERWLSNSWDRGLYKAMSWACLTRASRRIRRGMQWMSWLHIGVHVNPLSSNDSHTTGNQVILRRDELCKISSVRGRCCRKHNDDMLSIEYDCSESQILFSSHTRESSVAMWFINERDVVTLHDMSPTVRIQSPWMIIIQTLELCWWFIPLKLIKNWFATLQFNDMTRCKCYSLANNSLFGQCLKRESGDLCQAFWYVCIKYTQLWQWHADIPYIDEQTMKVHEHKFGGECDFPHCSESKREISIKRLSDCVILYRAAFCLGNSQSVVEISLYANRPLSA
jgi:hypothetical protein